MCQKAVGNAFSTMGIVQKSDIELSGGTPGWFRSSADVSRGFCDACGTPLFYSDSKSPTLGIMIGTLDDPRPFPPERQDGIESRMDWVLSLADLPEKGVTGSDGDQEWALAIQHSNRQFPDFGSPS